MGKVIFRFDVAYQKEEFFFDPLDKCETKYDISGAEVKNGYIEENEKTLDVEAYDVSDCSIWILEDVADIGISLDFKKLVRGKRRIIIGCSSSQKNTIVITVQYPHSYPSSNNRGLNAIFKGLAKSILGNNN